MSNIIVAMNRIILSLSIHQHEQLKAEVEEVRAFINAKSQQSNRGRWWDDEEQSAKAKAKMRDSATKRWGLVKVNIRSTGESLYFKNYDEASLLIGKTVRAIASKVSKSHNKVATFLVDDDVITVERVPCVEN